MKKIIFIAFALIALASTDANAQYLSVNNTTVKIDGNSHTSGKLLLNIHDADDCVALGFRLVFPEEIYEEYVFGSPIFFEHDMYHYDSKFLIVSDENNTLDGVTTIFDKRLLAANTASGPYTGRIADIEFATKDLKLITTPDVLFTVTVENQNDIITGIDSQVGTQDETIYSVSGIKQNSLKKGVNIIRRADGTTVKQFKGNS